MAHSIPFRRAARDAYVRMSVRTFGNHIGLGVNILHVLHRLAYRLFSGFKMPGAAPVETAQIRQRGYARILPRLSGEELSAIRDKVDRLFASPEKVVHSLEDGGLLRLKSCLRNLPELERFVTADEVREVLCAYFGGAYTVFSCDVYRTIPVESQGAEEIFPSLLWHFDNCPSYSLKMMVYLKDTTAENGALTVVDRETSSRVRSQGFWERGSASRFAQELERNAVRLEGPSGTVLLFSTHHCVHKATLPQKGLRDVAVFLLQPTFRFPGPWTDAMRDTYSRNYGYCVNPFTLRPLRTGDE